MRGEDEWINKSMKNESSKVSTSGNMVHELIIEME